MTKLGFYLKRFDYSLHERMLTARIATRSGSSLLHLALMPIVFAVIVTAILISLPIACSKAATYLGLSIVCLPKVDEDRYSSLLGNVAQASAALLALFFTSVSIVASTVYAKVPTEIRALVARDPLNWSYLRLLAHVAATATLAIAVHSVGVPGSFVLLVYVLVLASVCLLAFLPLGVRTFAQFDPAVLAMYPVQFFNRSLRVVTNAGRYWLDPSFQNHARRIAEEQLRRLEDLVVYSINDGHQNEAVLNLARVIHRLARNYAHRKPSVPSESLWFSRKLEFQRWQVANSPMTQISLETGAQPPPKSVPDHGFVEAKCEAMTLQCLQHLLARDGMNEVALLIMEINTTAATYATVSEQRQAMRLVKAVRTRLVEYLTTAGTSSEPLIHLQIIDVLCVAALSPILNTSLSLTDQPSERLVTLDSALMSLCPRKLCGTVQPRRVLRESEELMRRLQFEEATEGRIWTQAWYVRQMIAIAYADFVRDVIKDICVTVEQEFLAPAQELVAAKRALWAGLWLLRGVEACKKAEDQIHRLEVLYAELKGFHATELPWQPSGSEAALVAVGSCKSKVICLLAETVPGLCASLQEESLPDLVGQARARIADELVLMMERKEEKEFPKLFITYFNATLNVMRQFVDTAQQAEKSHYCRVAFDVMLDLMDISGLAYLFSELDGTHFGELVEPAWDLYLKGYDDPKAGVQLLFRTIDSKTDLPYLSPSAMQRRRWDERFVASMKNRGVKVDRNWGPRMDWSKCEAHTSAVIESVYVDYGHMTNEPYNYFGAMYLAKLDVAKELGLPYDVEECLRSIKSGGERQKRVADAKKRKNDKQ